jgi:hypothetical protein
MSLDNFVECPSCKQHTAARIWICVYGSLEHARATQSSPDFLSMMIPGPGILKMELCFSCKRFSPCLEFTPEEEAAIKRDNEQQQKTAAEGLKLKKLFGFFK